MLDGGSFRGRVVVVTGAAAGIGRATAEAFARLGADLALLDIDDAGLDETARRLAGSAARVERFPGDVADPAHCRATIAAVAERLGRIDGLCNVAGIAALRAIPRIEPDDWRRVFAVNVDGPFFLSQAALPHLERTSGSIVNVASSTAKVGGAFLVHYAASKAAVLQMTRAMAVETLHSTVRINAVAPGGVETEFLMRGGMPEDIDYELVKRMASPRGLSGTEEVADAIVYLSSPLAKTIHGACLAIDGGVTAG